MRYHLENRGDPIEAELQAILEQERLRERDRRRAGLIDTEPWLRWWERT